MYLKIVFKKKQNFGILENVFENSILKNQNFGILEFWKIYLKIVF